MLKGLFSHMFAKIVFVLCTYAIHLYLGKKLSAEEYGAIGVIISIITVNYNFLSNGTRQAISKLIAIKKYDERDLIKKGVIVQAAVAMVLTAVNYFAADSFAKILNTSHIVPYIKLSALMIPFTAGYFICIGIINGFRLFLVEATIVTLYPLLRLTIIPYIEYIFESSAQAVVMGFFTASVICCIVSGFFLISYYPKFTHSNLKISIREFVSNIGNFLIFFTCITIILNIDMLFVNALVAEKKYVGYYTGAINFAKVSYYLLSAIYIVLLPTIAKFYSENKIEDARNIIVAFGNAIVLLILPIVNIVGATSKEMLMLFYKPDYSAAAISATILMFSQFFIGIFVVINMCISSTREKKFCSYLSVFIVLCNFLFCYVFVKRASILGASLASLCSGGLGSLIAYVKARGIFGKIIDKSTIFLLIGNVALFFVTYFLKNLMIISNLFLLFIFYIIVYIVFVIIMILTKCVNIKKIIEVFCSSYDRKRGR